MARPIEWTLESMQCATDIICSRIALGESVRKILSEDRDQDILPSRKTFYEWLAQNKSLCDQYATFLEIRSDDMADEMLNIADEFGNDTITLEDGRVIENARIIARDRLRVDTRKWLLSKLHPKKYGDRVDIQSSDGSMSPKSIDVSLLTTEELLLRAQACSKIKE